ncbi:MAG TPA: energy transducer TonB [Thermoanaerobaculia bacterium]|nr:energy transducer TonB [Thermoanaerobaculia bacterium]
MRTVVLPLFLLASAAVAAPAKQTLGARSAHHELRVERNVISAEQIAYDVTLVDLDNGKTIVNSHVSGKPGEALDVIGGPNGPRARVRLAYSEHFFSATVNVIDGNTIVDEFRTWWRLEPQDAALVPPPLGTLPLRVGGDVKAPIVIKRVEPKYTDEARQNDVSGIVILEVVIDKDGRVKNAQVLKPLPFGLDQAALDAVRQWEFKPGTLNGAPVDVLFNLTVNFMLDKGKP